MIANGAAKRQSEGGPSIVDEQRFILSTRDTGYRSTAAAVAELVDNSLQAGADDIRVFVTQEGLGVDRTVRIAVLDNGSGMDARTLSTALRFGGSSRFDDRTGPGRFGMGLPNSSVSQAKRVDVYTWQRVGRVMHAYLDVDDIANGKQRYVPTPSTAQLPEWVRKDAKSATGTLVLWDRCDRLDFRKAPTIAVKLHESLGRKFRHFLWDGVKIKVNGELIAPVDYLCLGDGGEDALAVPYGKTFEREVRVPGDSTKTSVVRVRFSELKVAKLHNLPVEEKRLLGITKAAGVSIVRARREIDCGWYFMGAKRKENYDDWWRCEISFDPALDELFCVTHSKQGISPKEEILGILTPTLEATAHTLNSRARAAFTLAKTVPDAGTTAATKAASASERLLNPLESAGEAAKPTASAKIPPVSSGNGKPVPVNGRPKATADFRYRIDQAPLRTPDFYVWEQKDGGTILVTLNTNHTFFEEVYEPSRTSDAARFALECLILASVRADMAADTVGEQGWNERRRVIWSNTLAALLEHS